ncbi:MAG: patatin-like phospholipase family protein [Hyphomicrobiales bacterium]|nr:patatin-like phospholipase family protein [Hyphomicrobiales bacterium]
MAAIRTRPRDRECRLRRILTIDGGGIRGTFPAAFLANLEKDLEHPIGRYFDLISGTSTGGIIAIGLALGMSAADILKLYEEKGPAIFGQTRTGLSGWIAGRFRWGRWVFWGPKYDANPLRNALTEVLGQRRLGEAGTRLLVPAWHPKTQQVYIFKTAHHPRLQTDYKELAVDAAMATASAPTYFAQHITANDVGLVDGGLWANNPTGIAVVEATATLGWPASDLKVLSIGCLEDIMVVQKAYGAARLAPQLASLFMAGQSHGSLGIAHILTGDPHQRKAIYRISQPVPDGFYSLDNTRRIRDLKDRAFAEARTQKPILQPEFFGEPAEEFVPAYR